MLTHNTPGATLVYTTDGSLPTLENGTQVPPATAQSQPVWLERLARTTTFRVRAFKQDLLPSRPQTWTYIFPTDVMTQDAQATLAAGFPERWRTVVPDYGLDPDLVGRRICLAVSIVSSSSRRSSPCPASRS